VPYLFLSVRINQDINFYYKEEYSQQQRLVTLKENRAPSHDIKKQVWRDWLIWGNLVWSLGWDAWWDSHNDSRRSVQAERLLGRLAAAHGMHNLFKFYFVRFANITRIKSVHILASPWWRHPKIGRRPWQLGTPWAAEWTLIWLVSSEWAGRG
jgi:hypothetical protein